MAENCNVLIKTDGQKTKVFVNDSEVTNLRSVHFGASVGKVPTIILEVIPDSIELDAKDAVTMKDDGVSRFAVASYTVDELFQEICSRLKAAVKVSVARG